MKKLLPLFKSMPKYTKVCKIRENNGKVWAKSLRKYWESTRKAEFLNIADMQACKRAEFCGLWHVFPPRIFKHEFMSVQEYQL